MTNNGWTQAVLDTGMYALVVVGYYVLLWCSLGALAMLWDWLKGPWGEGG